MGCKLGELKKRLEELINGSTNIKYGGLKAIVDTIEKNGSLLTTSGLNSIGTIDERADYSHGEYRKYYRMMSNAVIKATGVHVHTAKSKSLLLSSVIRDMKYVVAGRYNPNSNDIVVADPVVTDAMIEDAVHQGLESQYYTRNMPDVPDEELAGYLAKDKNYQEIMSIKPQYIQELKDHIAEMVNKLSNTDIVIGHELVHAGAYLFMKANPEHSATKRMNELYSLAMSDKYRSKLENAVGTYWQTNVDEFLAEALSNPQMMKLMNSIRLTDAENKKYGARSLFKAFLRAVKGLLGNVEEGSFYGNILDSYTEILEMYKGSKEGLKSTGSMDGTILVDGLNKEADTILPINYGRIKRIVDGIEVTTKEARQVIDDIITERENNEDNCN